MIPDLEAWHAFGGVVVILMFLGGGALALQRLGVIRPRSAEAAAPGAPAGDVSDDLTGRVADLESRVAVIEERSKRNEQRLEGIGKLHGRIDGVVETTGRIEGEVTQMNRTLNVMLRHMLGEKAPP